MEWNCACAERGADTSWVWRVQLTSLYETMAASPLTKREVEILRLIAMGLSAKKIGRELAIAHRTVERHIDHIRLKTRTRNRAHMVAYAVREKLLSPAIASDVVG